MEDTSENRGSDLVADASGEVIALRIARHVPERPHCQDPRLRRENRLPRAPHSCPGDRRDRRNDHRNRPLLPQPRLRRTGAATGCLTALSSDARSRVD